MNGGPVTRGNRSGPSSPVLELDQVSKRFGDVAAVDAVSLDLAAGEVLTLVGPSGCGKSTALRLVAGLEHPDRGHVRIRGELVAGGGAWRQPEHRAVGVVFQDHALFPHLSVAGNVAFGLHGWPAERRRGRVGAVLELVELTGLAGRFPHELSGGEQQRVALARALAPEPALLLLDEPFSNLDRNLRHQVRGETLAVLRATRTAAVFVTHDQQEALAVGDRVAVLRAGRVEQVGSPGEVFDRPANRFVAGFMGDADFLPASVDGNQLRTEIGPLPLPDGLPAHGDWSSGGEPLEVVLRPHQLRLRADPSGQARAVAAEFLGGFVRYTVRLPSGRTIHALQPHTPRVTMLDPATALTAEWLPDSTPAVLPGAPEAPRTSGTIADVPVHAWAPRPPAADARDDERHVRGLASWRRLRRHQ